MKTDSHRPACSIVILNWNGRAHLPDCLAAMARQTTKGFEVIVVDNGSTDDSARWVRQHYPDIHLLDLEENRGFASGNNAAIAVARGDFVVLLNNDTRPADDWLQELLACADAHPEAGIVAAHLVDWEGRLTDSAGDGCRVTGRGYGRHRLQSAKTAPPSGPVFGGCAGAALYRRELIDDIGFLDDDFFLNFEDTDLAFRARLHGWTVWFCREAIVHHRISASQGAWSATNAYYGARNHVWVCIKNMPGWLLFKYAPLTILQTAVLGIVALRHGCLISYLRGLGASLKGMGRMLRKRRATMTRRTITTRELDKWLDPLNVSIGALSRLLHSR